jgi:Leucine-rich repeat (LRR) protein
VGKLEELDLQSSNIGQLPTAIGKLHKLQRLNLEHTDVTQLPESLRECSALREIAIPSGLAVDIKTYLPKGKWKTTKRAPAWYTRSG